jgi:hypothetical protein
MLRCKYIVCLVKNMIVNVNVFLGQIYLLQFITAQWPPSRRHFQPFLTTARALTVYQKTKLKIPCRFITSNEHLNVNKCWCQDLRLSQVPQMAPYAVCELPATVLSVDWVDSRDWIPTSSGDSLFIISTRFLGSIQLSYPIGSGVVSRRIKRSKREDDDPSSST